MANKRYYWLKLKNDFFQDRAIKKLRRVAGGDTYTVIYLKLLLFALADDGRLHYEGDEDNIAAQLALDIDESEDNVSMTLAYLEKTGLLQVISEQEFFLTRTPEMTGAESSSAERMRRLRAKQQAELPAPSESVTNCNIRYNVTDERHNVTPARNDVRERDACVTPERNNVQPSDKSVTPEKSLEFREEFRATEDREKEGYGEETESDFSNPNESALDAQSLQPAMQSAKPHVPYAQIQALYNEICVPQGFPLCRDMSNARQKAIRARFNSGYKLEDFEELFRKTAASSFLRGQNDRDWRATFDWLVADKNMAKVLSGNYDDHGNSRSMSATRGGSTGPAQPITNNPFLKYTQAHTDGGESYE